MRALLCSIVLVCACGHSSPPPRDAVVVDGLTKLTLSRTEGGSGNRWARWTATPEGIVRLAHDERGDLPETHRAFDAAGLRAVVSAVRARGLRAVPSEPDECGGGTSYRLEIERTGGPAQDLWSDCGRGSLLGDVPGFASDLDALVESR